MIRLEALQGLLARAPDHGLPAVLWLAGDEPLLLLEAADAIRASARTLGYTEREVLNVERGFRIESLLEHSQALSLFASRKLIELRFGGKPGKEIAQALADTLQNWPEDVRLLVSSPRLDRATQSSTWFSQIESCGVVVGIDEVGRTRLPEWLAARLSRQGQRADAQTLKLIAERVEGNLLAADQEVRKLALLLPQGPLDARAVREAVLDVARWDAFDLVDAALAADALAAQAVPVVLWALADAVRSLMRVQQGLNSGQAMGFALRAARIWGERERLVPGALRRLTQAQLTRLLRECARADRMTKGLEDGDDWQALESIALALAGAPVLALP